MGKVNNMKEIKDTGLKYVDGDRMLEGDSVEFSWYEFKVVPEKIEGVITYKNAAFYFESNLKINGKPAVERTIASILENNAQIPDKHPMYIKKVLKV